MFTSALLHGASDDLQVRPSRHRCICRQNSLRDWIFSRTELRARQIGIVQSLLATSRRHNAHPYDYLVAVLQRVGQHCAPEIEQLASRLWKSLCANKPLRSDLDQRDERR